MRTWGCERGAPRTPRLRAPRGLRTDPSYPHLPPQASSCAGGAIGLAAQCGQGCGRGSVCSDPKPTGAESDLRVGKLGCIWLSRKILNQPTSLPQNNGLGIFLKNTAEFDAASSQTANKPASLAKSELELDFGKK